MLFGLSQSIGSTRQEGTPLSKAIYNIPRKCTLLPDLDLQVSAAGAERGEGGVPKTSGNLSKDHGDGSGNENVKIALMKN